MSENDKSIFNKIEHNRLLAVQGAEAAERKIRDLEEEGRDYALRVFRSPDAVASLFYLSAEQLEPEYKLMERMERLIDEPREAGRLKGVAFLPQNPAVTRPHLEKVRDCLQEHIDAVGVRQNYRDLHQKAVNATRLPSARRNDALRELEHHREYCDVTRDTREQRAVERRRQGS